MLIESPDVWSSPFLKRWDCSCFFTRWYIMIYPIGSMYGIFTYIWRRFMGFHGGKNIPVPWILILDIYRIRFEVLFLLSVPSCMKPGWVLGRHLPAEARVLCHKQGRDIQVMQETVGRTQGELRRFFFLNRQIVKKPKAVRFNLFKMGLKFDDHSTESVWKLMFLDQNQVPSAFTKIGLHWWCV